MLIDAKFRTKAYQKSVKKLFHGMEELQKLVSSIGLTTTTWKYVGVFVALNGAQLFDCDECSPFVVTGTGSFRKNFKVIEEIIVSNQDYWQPEDHVEEFVGLATQIMFIAQGNSKALVTRLSCVRKTADQVERASTFENIIKRMPEQQVALALHIPFLFLNG